MTLPCKDSACMVDMAKQFNQVQDNLRDDPQLQPFVLPNVRLTGRTIGGGSYGTVEELEVNGLLCAGKKLHDILVRHDNEGLQRILGKFVEECTLLASLHHPHIVQFLGICFLEASDLPVLVMEYLPYCLDSLLEGPDRVDLPLALKYAILCDVVRGLLHLHTCTPPIIHRDLTAKNVLLTAAMTAKLADLGVARILNEQPGRMAVTMTQTPGTMAYMPPEALGRNAKYNAAIDIFSFGHLTLYTFVQFFPVPTAPTRPDPTNPGMVIGLTEVQRRSEQMEQLSRQLGGRHPVVQLVTQCLYNDHRQRPSARQVLTQLEEMRATVRDPYSDLSKLELIQALRRREGGGGGDDLQTQVTQLQGQLEEREAQLQVCRAEVETKDAEVQRLLFRVQDMESELTRREQEFRELRDQQSPPMSLSWTRGKSLLSARYWTSAAVLNEKIYVCGQSDRDELEYIIQVYTPDSSTWGQLPLPQCPVRLFAMAIVNWQLAIIGGEDVEEYIVSALQVWDCTSQNWTTPYPEMPTARQKAVAVSHQQYLVVAGGLGEMYSQLDTVEILNSLTKEWFTASSMPYACEYLSSAVVHDRLYLLGGESPDDVAEKLMFSVVLPMLISHAISPLQVTPPSWEVTEVNHKLSTAVAFRDSLLAVGGLDDRYIVRSDIYCYNPQTKQWWKVGELPTAVRSCGCTVLSSGELMVLGGWMGRCCSNDVHIARV